MELYKQPNAAAFVSSLLLSSDLSDVVLTVADGAELHAHSLLLMGRSIVFRTMLESSFREARYRRVQLDSSEEVAGLLSFVV
jgi:hypothetical protein